MYSLTAVGGIQYTTEMANKKTSRSRPTRINHVFRGCREVITAGSAATGQTPANILTTSGGSYAYSWPLCPNGLSTATYTTTAYAQGTAGNVFPPVLRGLYNRSVDFQWYRVTRAKFVFVGNVGSTTAGSITLAGYSDPIDVGVITNQANVSSSQSAKSFDLASSSSKELSVNIPVDSAWKKVTDKLLVPGGVSPFAGSSTTMLVPVNTVSDLCFGAVSISVVGVGGAVSIGYVYIDYDVEFKGLIDSSVNL